MPKFRKCPNCNEKQGFFWIKKMNKKGTAWECKSCQIMLMENKYAYIPLFLVFLSPSLFIGYPFLYGIIAIFIFLGIAFTLPLRIADSSKEN